MSEPSKIILKRAGVDDSILVGEILGEAFVGDPLMKWISPDPEFPRWCWSLAVSFFLPYKEVHVTENGLGAAMWLPPGVELNIHPSLTMLWNTYRHFGIKSIMRFFHYMNTLEKHHPEDKHYYLFAIGVRPIARNQGIGSALLEYVLQECDRINVRAYLETSKSLNLQFYKRYGFEVRDEIALPNDGPPLWLMCRESKK